MGKPRRLSYIAVPSQIINSLSSSSLNSLLESPKKSSKRGKKFVLCSNLIKRPTLCFLTLIFVVGFFGLIKLYFNLNLEPLTQLFPTPCNQLDTVKSNNGIMLAQEEQLGLNKSMRRLSEDKNIKMVNEKENEEASSTFWKQPDSFGYKPCLTFSQEYKKTSPDILKDRTKYLMVVVSGGMNQQRNQIVDAVVIARILGAALVVPVLQVNIIWGDESEFSDIFDLEHFKKTLADDVRIVSSLPSTHLRTKPPEESQTPFDASPRWIRQHYHGKLRRYGVLLLRGLDSRLSKDLPSDLQKLRCKVAFHALKFAPHILHIGNKIAERMSHKGPYIALHLRMEKDVWIRTGCSPGLSTEYDDMIENERKQRPKLLTAKSNMTSHDRKLAGLCPLNALEVARLLKALGAPESARIYWAGGDPFGGKDALLPLTAEFPHFYNKEDLARPGELAPFANRASFMAAIDFIVCEKSDVFLASHGGNMGHAIQGFRAYAGHKKLITPNKRHMLPYFLNTSLPETEFNKIVKELHRDSLGQPEFRTSKPDRDVTKYPVPECMCNTSDIHSSA
ncbi:O-fucosyltransferase 20-like [Amaranthus tricolor]|uniref:O-fucosyltransferase 20-like n=1 Tax=Amaranthus tricolor TaxID=29722 RepID=UPI0025911079|nr:O-fucosyltransferase 20-like [Amaranthus tricolor]